MTADFDETVYRIRSIDFDQQSYERRCHVYLPQFYRENNPIVEMGMRCMTRQTFRQYRREERALIGSRARAERDRLEQLLATMRPEPLAPHDNVVHLRTELARYHKDNRYYRCTTMGDLVEAHLALVGWN